MSVSNTGYALDSGYPKKVLTPNVISGKIQKLVLILDDLFSDIIDLK